MMLSLDPAKSRQLYDLCCKKELNEALKVIALTLIGDDTVDVNYSPEDVKGRTPLIQASRNGHVEMVRALANHPKVDINHARISDGRTALLVALYFGHNEVIKILLKHPQIDVNQVDKKNRCPLFLAARNGNIDVVKMLVEHQELNINQMLIDTGCASLSVAAENGHDEVVKLLLKHPDIDVNQKTHTGSTPLIFAAQNGHDKVVKILLQHPQINVNLARTDTGSTPLFIAAQEKHDKVVSTLLEHPQINVNLARTKDGITPIWMAAQKGSELVVKTLLAFNHPIDLLVKANPGEQPWRNLTAAEQAEHLHHMKIFELLTLFAPSRDQKKKNEQARIRTNLRKELRLNVLDAAESLALVVLLSDGYLEFRDFDKKKDEKSKRKKAKRFFGMIRDLPLELQTIICNYTFERNIIFISVKQFTQGLRSILKFFA